MQSLHVPTLIFGHSMAKAEMERERVGASLQQQPQGALTPSTGHSCCSQPALPMKPILGSTGRVTTCLAIPQVGWLKLPSDPGKWRIWPLHASHCHVPAAAGQRLGSPLISLPM